MKAQMLIIIYEKGGSLEEMVSDTYEARQFNIYVTNK